MSVKATKAAHPTDPTILVVGNTVSADLTLAWIKLQTAWGDEENSRVKFKELQPDRTEIESFYYEEIAFYCKYKGVCKLGKVVRRGPVSENKKEHIEYCLENGSFYSYSTYTLGELKLFLEPIGEWKSLGY